MATSIVFDTPAVFLFVSRRTGLARVEGMQGIGLERDGALVAGVIYEGVNRFNAWMHVAADDSRLWMTRPYLRTCFAYPFVQCGVSRVRGYVNASNTDAIRFDEHLGFRREAVLEGAAPDGGDVFIYVMRREDCRYV